MKVAIYSRKSKFTVKGESIENQIQICKNYISNFDVDDIKIYEDEGFSGGNTNRPEFQKMLKDAKNKKYDTLICYRLDRISRNVLDFSSTLEILNKYNISFISIKEQFDTSTPMGRAMMYIASVFAQLERETIAERVRDNMMQLARTGRWLGGITPTGFKSAPVSYLDNNGKQKKMYKLVPVMEEIEYVKILFKKYIELNGVHKLEGYCFKNNIKSKNNKFYEKSALISILSNPVYCTADLNFYNYCKVKNMDIALDKSEFTGEYGAMAYNRRDEREKYIKKKDYEDWVISIGKHRGIIDCIEWIKVQNMLEENSSKAPREGTSRISLLTPLLVCGSCGNKLRVAYKYDDGEVKHHYYKCRLKERSRGKECNISNLNGKETEKMVIDFFKGIDFPSSSINKQLDKMKKEMLKQDNKSNSNILMSKIKDIEKSIENLTIQLAANSSSAAAAYIIKQIERLDSEKKTIEGSIEGLYDIEETILIQKLNSDLLVNEIKYFAKNVDNLSFEEKKQSLQRMIEKITWNGEKIKVKLLGL